jgi:hypothetical protein
LLTAQAGEAELKYRREKMMMDSMQQYGIRGDTPSEKMRFMGNLAIDSGDAEAARKLFDSASQIDSRAVNAQAAQTRQQFMNSTMQLRTLDLQGRLLGGATDQKSWDAGNAYYFMMTHQMSPYAGQPFSKELAAKVTQNSMTAKDRIAKDLDAKRTSSLDSIRAARERDVDSLISTRRQRLDLERQRLAKLAKAGAGVKDPGRDLQTQAMRKIRESYPDLSTDGETLNTAAYGIASEAQALRRNNPALTTEESLGRAFKTAVERGDFKTTPRPTVPVLGWEYGSGKTGYTGGGRTEETAIPLPKGADPSKLEKGHFYLDGGVTAKWDPDDPEAEGGWVYPENEGAAEEEGALNEESEE